ncbi:diaminopimelate decarboxylase [Patescibacteria group bacterium]|nr:diaminopimelate decarboxylase [Patescibacteria group bacterium]MBU1500446.1 diaminopimelate decarboxylase [Patescibacteria group bacterium]MBU2080514.1 diaminopimelate decarboxylase [Patescibacteria group bacterium]MBU2123681.1 diaminopimelate decarboxylase [Patescibacteria group bacterium]MBU2194537.1 diaminopimelate decarboxylase [Patescibacteria group bacterium]
MSSISGIQCKTLVQAARKFGTPVYVYNQDRVEAQCKKLQKHFPEITFHYAVKANANPELLRIIRKQGIGAEGVSGGELVAAMSAGFKKKDLSFTCSNLTEEELAAAVATGARVHLDSLTQLEQWGRHKLGSQVSLRLNQGIGAGHHKHVITGGPDSKFGISLSDIPEAKRIAKQYGLEITGVQQHIGSNALDEAVLLKAAGVLLKTAETFEGITHIDFGGGLGVPYKPQETELNLVSLGKKFSMLIKDFRKKHGAHIEFAMEPGRFLVAQAGLLLVSVTDIKHTEKHCFVGVNSGFNHLLRPALYDSYHPVENVVRTRGKKAHVTIAGNVCESGDVFAAQRTMYTPEIGDLLAITHAGAYGFTMASMYNLRVLPKEVLVTKANTLKDISFDPREFAR